MRAVFVVGLGLISAFLIAGPAVAAEKVDFNRHIRSILADKCYACHGPDAEEIQGDLRLDKRDVAVSSGAIVPGDSAKSGLVERIDSTDPDVVMPPPDSHKELTAAEKELLRQWIAEGAEYKDHWAFSPPIKAAQNTDNVELKQWAKNAVDEFVWRQLQEKGLKPAPQASPETLIRRVSLDLRGFPPTIDEIDEFLNDESPDAYAKMVDRMLDSQHFGEKMARIWMDLARYGDTNGYHYDSTRQVWMWRDWVIRSYNENMPFDQFTIEQLAGDLIPNATPQQRIASGFNRNTRYNEEGGADPDEWRVRYAVDRTSTLGLVWMGMTLNCAECHSHKYDPISHKEFYQLYAFFNSLDEPGAQGHNQKYPPLLEVPTPEHEQKLATLKKQLADRQSDVKSLLASINYQEPPASEQEDKPKVKETFWIDDATPAGATLAGEGQAGAPNWHYVSGGTHPQPFRGSKATRRQGAGRSQHFFHNARETLEIGDNCQLFAHVWIDPKNPPKTIQLQFNDGSWEHRAYWGEDRGYGAGRDYTGNSKQGPLPEAGKWVRLEVSAEDVGLKPGAKLNGWAFTQFDGTVYYDAAGVQQKTVSQRQQRSLLAWTEAAAVNKKLKLPGDVRKAINVAADKRSDAQHKQISDYYLQNVFEETAPKFTELRNQIAATEKQIQSQTGSVPFQLVSVEMAKPRPAHILMRGDFLKPGEKVERDVPAIFPRLPQGQPRNRLGLAHWLFDTEHPLTARVAVNRYWAQLFGQGIVATVGDFGHLGRFPTHPDLLDWLSVEFRESGWNRKHMFRLMINSATYRQSSVVRDEALAVDPKNQFLAYAPRFRMPAEEIRDSALKISGLLSDKIGGPPVFPFQPKDYYRGKKGGWNWRLSQNEDRYRRGLYTFWRRTTPYPTFIIFDAPDRSECVVERARTNTPLQALATMNDPQFVEAARVFGQKMISLQVDGDSADPRKLTVARLVTAFRRTVARYPTQQEINVLVSALEKHRAHYEANPDQAAQMVQHGAYPKAEGVDVVEQAAWTAICNTLLNLDETVTRE